MSKLTVRSHQRGPFLKITLLVMRADNNLSEMTTNHFNINNLAVVVIKLKAVSNPACHLGIKVHFKKSDNAKNSIVSLNITSNEYDKQFFCNSDWVELTLPSKMYDSCLNDASPNTMLYIIDIKMTAHDIMPVASSTFKELNSENFDFNLKAEDGTVPMHKAVLFVQSDMFRSMLRGKWMETDENTMKMPNFSAQTLQHLKDYMYLGTLPKDGIGPLLVLAKYCLMDDLVDKCSDILIKSVKPETFDALVDLACQNKIPELIKGLFLRIPDDVINGISQLSINANKPNSTKLSFVIFFFRSLDDNVCDINSDVCHHRASTISAPLDKTTRFYKSRYW